jgi:hypothetical protein
MFTVQSALAEAGPYNFINIHYYPNAAILFGTEVKGGFEYGGKLYAGQETFANHMGKFDTCIECHMGTKSDANATDYTGSSHMVSKPTPADCVYCHGQDVAQPNPGADPAKFAFTGIRPASIPDYDGDGILSESIQSELQGLEKDLFKYLQAAGTRAGSPLIYDSHAYPYFFNDSNANGAIDPGEAIYPNRYAFPNGRMLKAAYNYQMSKKAPSGYAHNSLYIAQVLVDSIVDLGGDASKYGWR